MKLPVCQNFIASYKTDALWCRFALMSLKKYSRNFLPPVVAVTTDDFPQFRKIADEVYPEAQIKVFDGHGFMRAQIAMCSCDLLCPDADVIFLLGSDCIAADIYTPEPYFDAASGKPVMLYNTYAHLLKHHPGVKPWQVGTERVLGFETPWETMRRCPTTHPRELYPAMRAHVEKLHKQPFADYIYAADKIHKNTSETNILGSYAKQFMPDIYHWHGMDEKYQESVKKYPNACLQFWSKGGIDKKCDQKLDYPGGNTFGKTPRSIITEVLAKPSPTQINPEWEKLTPANDVVFGQANIIISEPEVEEVWDEAVAEQTLFPPRMVCALGVSHKDVDLAVGWLNWTSYLATLEEGTCMNYTLVIAGTQRLDPSDWKRLRDAIMSSVHMFQIEGMVLPDELEKGYPISASHLFFRTLEHCEQNHPGSPVLWVESDTVPMRPGWFSEIAAEYETCGKPFMGYLEGVTAIKHMPGVAVYPPNWRALSPLLANVLKAPDDKVWGPGKGRAFDIWASPETVPQMAVAKTIQQIWRPKPFTEAALGLIKEETALFHQCKIGRLIEVLARTRYPDYLGRIKTAPVEEEKPSKLFCVPGHLYKVVIGSQKFDVERRVKRFMGSFSSIIRPTNMRDQRTLEAAAVAGKVAEITEETLAAEARKLLPKKGRMQHV